MTQNSPLKATARSRRPVSVVLATNALSSFISAGYGTALALLELGAAAFYASGAAERIVGPSAPWFVLLAVVIGLALRAAELEGCSLFAPGGLYGTVKEAFGKAAATAAASSLLIDHFFLGALAASVVGQYVSVAAHAFSRAEPIYREIAAQDIATVAALGLLCATWWQRRQGRSMAGQRITRAVARIVALLALIVCWGLATVVFRGNISVAPLPRVGDAPLTFLTALGSCLFAAGGVEALAHVAPELPQPRIRHLRRTAVVVGAYALLVTAGSSFLVAALVPVADATGRLDAPLAALPLYLAAPLWVRVVLVLAMIAAGGFLLARTVQRAALSAQNLLLRLADDGVLTGSLRVLHRRFGTPSHAIDFTAAAQLAIVFVTAGRVSWIARLYAVGVIWSALFKLAALVRMRVRRPGPRAFRVPLNLTAAGREWPLGLGLLAALLAVVMAVMLTTGDPASLAGTGLLLALAILFGASERRLAAEARSQTATLDEFELLPATDVGLDQVNVRPGNLLVAVRKPHFLAHLAAALQAAGDRDVVVMTARLIGIDAGDDPALAPRPTEQERRLLTAVLHVAERHGRAVRLLIVPATNVFDAVVEAIVRLRSSEVYVGESETLSADDQSRLLGEAWERLPKSEPFDVRLVIHHSSGRTAVYHLGAHAPTLSADDLQLIHTLWLDVVKAVGPHVHHHHVVRAALTSMEEQLHGPDRDEALDLVRQVARPADELAGVVRARDFTRLRDMVRNRPASDLARVLTDLTIEDQVVTFRVLPRKIAAATFEYLSREAQEALLKAMAQEEVAALLNNMAPDDRTMFLEELPASATQQLLTLLTPDERTVAVTLLGYPEGSIGRLMTPDYIAVREHWTVQEVLDYVRVHGQDSETLNVIYVVDDHGVLVDDVRIREFLLTSPASKVADLMDRRFVALKAADDQHTAVAVFRTEDRSALPVTDSAGVLIGIVTIDDVLDVAEAAATKEIQRIGGSEALDEPYMRIAFPRMIQKRAGWLTALFLGEMLTATAMGVFEQEIARAVVLALFVPLIISSGGNSGSQASTLVIRAIALGEVQLADWWRVMRREAAAGLALGSILGAIGFLRITIWSAFSTLYGPHWLLVALTVGTALVGVVLWGTLIGSLLPFLLRRLGFDPAASSAPFVATLVDVTGLVIYFSVGLAILRGTLL